MLFCNALQKDNGELWKETIEGQLHTHFFGYAANLKGLPFPKLAYENWWGIRVA